MNYTIEISSVDARRITDQIKAGVEAVWHLIEQAYTTRAWSALGYSSWDDYCTREFGTSRLRLPREERQEVVASLRESGLSIRAIAAATGVSRDTVHKAIDTCQKSDTSDPQPITGTDGKTYTPKPRPAASEPTITDDEVDDPVPDDRFISQDDLDALNAPAPAPSSNMPEPGKPKRKPLTDQARDAGWELRKATERLERLTEDDRFDPQKEKMAPHLRGHLTHAIEVCQDLLDRIN